MLLFLSEQIGATLELLFAVDDNFAAEDVQRCTEVSMSKHVSWSTSQCLYLRASVSQLGQELLYKAEFNCYVEVTLNVHPVVECRGELLERMNSHLDLCLRDREAPTEGGDLRV